MSDKTKYVVGIYRDTDRRSGPEGKFFQEIVALIFPKSVTHADVDHLFSGVLSAGFVSVGNGEVRCYGESETLKVKSMPDVDWYYVATALGFPVRTVPPGPPMTIDQAREIIKKREDEARAKRKLY